MLFIDSKSIPLATSHTLTINAETSDVSNKDISNGAWRAEEVSQFSWEASTDNLYSRNGVGTLFDAMTNRTPINAIFAEKTESDSAALPANGSWTPNTGQVLPTSYYAGKVVITSLQVTAQNGENATFTATFTGYGELKHYTGEYEPEPEPGEKQSPKPKIPNA